MFVILPFLFLNRDAKSGAYRSSMLYYVPSLSVDTMYRDYLVRLYHKDCFAAEHLW
jgi:hypothetical protein